MEPGVIAAIILVLFAGGGAIVLARQRDLSLSLPGFRGAGALAPGSADTFAETSGAIAAEAPHLEPVPLFGNKLEGPPNVAAIDADVLPALPSQLEEGIGRVEQRLDELQRAIEQQSAKLERLRADLASQGERESTERAAALERLRADLSGMLSRLVAARQTAATDRRLEATGELYARLARLESALSAVSNPILLPGEAYTPPAELLPEALVWENWNEVGERAFALADTYSAERLYLSDETRHAVGHFVTELRLLLTRSIYPNLQIDPDAAQQAALRASLEEMAAELPKVRAALDQEFRQLTRD